MRADSVKIDTQESNENSDINKDDNQGMSTEIMFEKYSIHILTF